jgi:sugar phosphate isomerase/epimerase
MGFAGVELEDDLYGQRPEVFRRMVEDAGMKISGVHVNLLGSDRPEQLLDRALRLGTRDLVVPLISQRDFQRPDGVERAADSLNRALGLAQACELKLGYHNHHWEFQRTGGSSYLDQLFSRLDPGVFAEVDVYWARVGGADPAAVIRQLGPRARFLHLKDGPANSVEAPMCALGEGRIDLAAVLDAARAAEWHVVEIDHCRGDMLEALRRSLAYLRNRTAASPAAGGQACSATE